ncbi:hypothetical protein AX17_007347 [Amanita inopinata Kibby_2008]|nr:hypothetical protein AX17_007347 [Amanita inopinata Kibby_2008]
MESSPNVDLPVEPESSDAAIRSTKRKLDQAFHVLDAAVGTTETLDHPPSKKIHTSRSLYSTLAKYGIKTKETKPSPIYHPESLSKSTPHLSAILSRAASRTKKNISLRFGGQSTVPAPALSGMAEYRPSSTTSFLSRLATYKLSTYANKPAAIDAVATAKCGWINDGKDRLVCGLCKSSWVVAGREGMSREAANALVEKQRHSLVEAHKDGCPWKSRQCDDSIYRIPLQSPAAMLKDLKTNAVSLGPLMEDVNVKHPLTAKQLNSLRAVTASLIITEVMESDYQERSASRPCSPVPVHSEPTENPILASLFGWSVLPPTTVAISSRRTSLSRASSVAPSATPPRMSFSSPTAFAPYSKTPTRILGKNMTIRDNALLYCSLCQRRVGLWAFAPHPADEAAPALGIEPRDTSKQKTPSQRPFDLLKEHRSFCPYVVRSTVIPSLPIESAPTSCANQSGKSSHERSVSSACLSGTISGNLEGWRAVLTTVLRYGMKQRVTNTIPDNEIHTENGVSEPMEVDAVKAMVTGVKSRGGRDLLNATYRLENQQTSIVASIPNRTS